MAPEYGATTGFFAIDSHTLGYLRSTGREAAHVRQVETYARRVGLWFDPQAEPRYTRTIDVDLSAVGMHIAGPRRPQDLLDYTQARASLAALQFRRTTVHPMMPRHPVAVAAITSCTNTSDPSLLIAAGLLARKARQFGRRVPAWVKTSLGPGSPAAAAYLQRAGLIDDLSAVGFDIVGYGCTTCIGNSGPLPESIREARDTGAIHPVAVLSGNRNFPGRIHPNLDLGFLMSPPLVIAFALAGDAEVDLGSEPVQVNPQGRAVQLSDLWPTRDEVAAALRQSADPEDFRREFLIAARNPAWHALHAPDAPRFPWNTTSTALRRPPFAAADQGTQLGHYTAYPLLIVGDDHHHRPYLAGQCNPAGQPGGRLSGRARRRPARPERVRLPARQLGSDGARRVPQQHAGEPVAAWPAGGAYAARSEWHGRADPGGCRTL
jgi:aconitate hydratase